MAHQVPGALLRRRRQSLAVKRQGRRKAVAELGLGHVAADTSTHAGDAPRLPGPQRC